MDYEEIKKRIIKDLECNINPTYRRYGLSNEEFRTIVKKMAEEGLVDYELTIEKLPNGDPHPHDGDIKRVTLKK